MYTIWQPCSEGLIKGTGKMAAKIEQRKKVDQK
jgi:hypothetical protein